MGEELNSRKKGAIEMPLVNVTRLENIKRCQDKIGILKIKESVVTLMAQENKNCIFYLCNATLKQNLVVRSISTHAAHRRVSMSGCCAYMCGVLLILV